MLMVDEKFYFGMLGTPHNNYVPESVDIYLVICEVPYDRLEDGDWVLIGSPDVCNFCLYYRDFFYSYRSGVVSTSLVMKGIYKKLIF